MPPPLTAVAALAALGAALLAGTPAWALYKIVGPDGRVTYTDREPPPGAGRVQSVRPGGGVAPMVWPPVLRDPVQRFPVKLYTVADCGPPCEQGRALLRERGVPYQELLASTDDERGAWIRLLGTADAPVLSVGQQRMPRMNAEQWQATLDLAGYPRLSALPPGYEPPAVQPLLPRPAAAERPRAADPAPAAPVFPPSEPGAIRF